MACDISQFNIRPTYILFDSLMSLQSYGFRVHDDNKEMSPQIQCGAKNENGSPQSDSKV